jgi:hypothetical protein
MFKKKTGKQLLGDVMQQMANPAQSKKGGKKKASKLATNPMIGRDLGGAGPTEMAARGDRPNVGDWAWNKGGKYKAKKKTAKKRKSEKEC